LGKVHITTQKELEVKFDVPIGSGELELIGKASSVLEKAGWHTEPTRVVLRTVTYYDAKDLTFPLFTERKTLRELSNWRPQHRMGLARYDYKEGSEEDREERNCWKDELLSPKEFRKLYGIEMKIMPVAVAETAHAKLKATNDGNELELEVDSFYKIWTPEGNYQGEPFKELEIEAVQRNMKKKEFLGLGREIGRLLGLEEVLDQKYGRVILSIPYYNELLKKKSKP